MENKKSSATFKLKVKKGFTLIELLVVVLIIGILVAVALPQYQKAVLKAKMTQTFIAGKAYFQAQRVYRLANGELADSANKLDIKISVNGWDKVSVGNFLQVQDYAEGVQFDFWPAGNTNGHPTKDRFVCIVYDTAPRKEIAKAVCKSLTGHNGGHSSDLKRTHYSREW